MMPGRFRRRSCRTWKLALTTPTPLPDWKLEEIIAADDRYYRPLFGSDDAGSMATELLALRTLTQRMRAALQDIAGYALVADMTATRGNRMSDVLSAKSNGIERIRDRVHAFEGGE